MAERKINISICIPTYNKYETIEYTILSVLKQSYTNWELIVIDDSNNDYTKKIVSKYSLIDSKIRYIKNSQRLGLVKNWNACIKHAKYEYVYILHHDDFLLPAILSDYNTFIEKYPDCGIIHSNCYYARLPYFKSSVGITQNTTILPRGDKAMEKILFNNNIACSSVMVRKACYDHVGGFDEEAWVSPDWEMWARIAQFYDIGHLDRFGCVVMMDNCNTHLSAIDIDEFSHQQQYYYNKIITYFTTYYNIHNYLHKRAEENLKKTIEGLGFHYLRALKFGVAYKYMRKIHYINITKILTTIMKSLARNCINRVFVPKKDYKQVFNMYYNSEIKQQSVNRI